MRCITLQGGTMHCAGLCFIAKQVSSANLYRRGAKLQGCPDARTVDDAACCNHWQPHCTHYLHE